MMKIVFTEPGVVKPKLATVWVGLAVVTLAGVAPLSYAGPLPTGGNFVAGSGSISTNGASLTVNQTSGRGIIDWNDFSIGNGSHVAFNNGSGATLNRVTGTNPSAIYGTLSATGSVYLINAHGIVVGPNGQITTGGRFVASTLDADNTAFMNGGALTLSGASKADVVNLGQIGSTNGDVFLIATGSVQNFGSISASKGTAELAAGKTVLLQDSTSTRQVFVQAGSGGNIVNGGLIAAAQASLQAADGNIYALSGNHQAIRATGTATRDGHVWLVADTGNVFLESGVEAKNADGSGGTIDTTAGKIEFNPFGATMQAGQWNVTTPGFTLGHLAASTFSRSLSAGTSIAVQTTGAGGNSGDIDVAASLGWTGAASLSLNAFRNVQVEQGVTIKNAGAGSLALRADATAADNAGGVVNDGIVDWSKSTGLVNLYRDMNGAYSPGTLLGNSAWTSLPDEGIVSQMTAYKLVNSLADLENVSQDLAGNYALGRDITFGSGYIDQIAGASPFMGQFDGMGHTLNGVSIKAGSQGFFYGWGGPLFGVIGTTGVVRNLGLSNGDGGVGHCYSSACYLGVLASENDGLIARSYSTGGFYFNDFGPGTGYSIGGLVGLNTGKIVQSWSGASVSGLPDFTGGPGNGDLGGLVANNTGTIKQSYATGSVSGGGWAFVGGLAGTSSGTVAESFSTGAVSGGGGSFWFGPGGAAGGFIGTGSGGGGTDYWNAQTSGMHADSGGVPAPNGLTTAQMSTAASFVGWDFGAGGAWTMPAGGQHPVLRWQAE
ncbi:filamentous hemagglutinin N-terminal domain-containing protein [Trinickia dinghuensis]|uniref:Filamentous hemagglutinin N-terminal domain-containing protein n=1 Tax=Trinickia dinghuensis TaxID=2291023 RepID=A0A3D8JNL0_9BURK|nr:filamentous hemagglutinin N-terminal domain-containing protein [Trinickia dinghuensis]RDU94598.1 filamentous hemagglutinin N-terminal domain-containing protein [Trinickia dinghuensis]